MRISRRTQTRPQGHETAFRLAVMRHPYRRSCLNAEGPRLSRQPQFFLIPDSVWRSRCLRQNDEQGCRMTRVLVIEDERKVLRSLERGLQAEGYEVVTASNGDDGYKRATTESFGCMILDLMLPGRDGLQVLADMRK